MRDAPHLLPRDARHGIEVDAQFIGVVEIVGAHGMRVQFQAREVGHPDERRGIARDDFFGAAPRRESQRHDVDPGRARLRRAFLVEEFAVDSVRVPDEDVGTAAGSAERSLGDHEIVTREIELRVAGLRKQDFLRVGDRDLAARCVQNLRHRW